MRLSIEQEKLRNTYLKTLRKLHPGTETVYVQVESIMEILGEQVCFNNDLFPYVSRVQMEPSQTNQDSSDVVKAMTSTVEMGLAPANPKLLLRLMEEAGT